MQKTTLVNVHGDMAKKLSFIANYGTQGEKMVIIVPKAYHKDIQKFKKPIKVVVEDMDLGMTTVSGSSSKSDD
jgi:hypothetical protein